MQLSPFDQVHRQLGASFENYLGWSLPADFGDIKAETTALNKHCVVFDLSSFGRIQLSGNSIKKTLTAVFNTDNGSFPEGRWVWGKPISHPSSQFCRIGRSNGQYFILTLPGQAATVSAVIEAASGGAVKSADVTCQTAMLGLYGPMAYASLRGVLPLDIDYLEAGDVEKMSFMMMSFTLLRGSWLAGEGVEVICPAAAGGLVAGAIVKYRHKHNITPAGMGCLQAAMTKMTNPL